MKNKKIGITILHSYDTMPLFYSLFPFLRKEFVDFEFHFAASVDFCLNKDRNDHLIITRLLNKGPWKGVDVIPVMEKFRKKYKRVAWFNDEDGTAITRSEVLPFVDKYLKKQAFKDRSLYQKEIYTNLYAEYYHKEYGVSDDKEFITPPVSGEHLPKIEIAWNLGVGCYPRKDLLRRAGLVSAKYLSVFLTPYFYTDPAGSSFPDNRELYDVHARFNLSKRKSSAFQREFLLDKIADNERFLTGHTGSSEYQREIRNSKIVLSPFGLGEVCFRDFEAVLGGALLLKPDMGHVETWPDIYRPYDTYIPFKWDASDLLEKMEYYLENDTERRAITRRAFDVYQQELDKLDNKATEMLRSFVE